MLIWMLSFMVSGLIHFLAFLALDRLAPVPPSERPGPVIEERGPPAVRANETRVAAGVAFAAGIAGVIAGLAVASPVLLTAAGYIFLATFPLVAQGVIAQRVQRETAADRAAAPEETFAEIQAKFGPVIGPLVFVHELVHRFTARLGVGKLGRSGRILDEALAYAVEYAAALPVVAVSSLVLGMRKMFAVITARAARAPPAPAAEPVIVAAPAEGVVVRSAPTPATRVRSGIELKPAEIEALVERMTGQMQYVVSLSPSFLETCLENMGVVCPVGQMDIIEVSYRAHGINKDVFRVDITKKDGAKIQFSLALKTEKEEDAVLFEEGELEAQQKLQGTGLVPRLGGVFHIERTDEGYGNVSWEQPEGRKRDFTTIAIEEFIEGPTAAELLDENDELDAATRTKAVTTWMRIFFALNGIRMEGRFLAPYDIHLNNVIVNENSPDKSIVAVDLGRQKEYYRLDQYLAVVLYHYTDEAAAALAVLPELWPDVDWSGLFDKVKKYVQGIEKTYFPGEETPEELAERKVRLDDISWTKADIQRIVSAIEAYNVPAERIPAEEEVPEPEAEVPKAETGLDRLLRTAREYRLHPADVVEVISSYRNSKGRLGDLSKWVARKIRTEAVLSEDLEGIIARIAAYPDIEQVTDTVWGRIDLDLVPPNARSNIHKRAAGLISRLEREINRVIGDERLANSHTALLLKVKRLNDTRTLSDREKEEVLQELLSASTDALMSEEALALLRDELIWFIKNAKNRHKLMAVNVAREFGLLRPRRTLNLGERYKAKGGLDKPIVKAIGEEFDIGKEELLFIEEASSEITVEMPLEDAAEFEMDVDALTIDKILPRNIYWQYLYNTPAEREDFIGRIRNLSGLTEFIKEHFKKLYPKAEVVSIIVFGSYMYPLGREVRASDIDIAVVVDGDVSQEELWAQKTHLFKIGLPKSVFSEEARARGNVVDVADITPLHIRDFSDPEARNPHGPFWLAYANRFGTGVPIYLRDGVSNDPFMREPTHGSLLAKSVELIDKGMFKYAEQLQNHPRTACSKLVKRTIEAIALLHIIDRGLVEEDFFVDYQNLFKEYLEGEDIEEVRREEFTRRFFDLLTRDAARLIGWAETRASATGAISREDALKFSSILKRRIRDMAFLFDIPVPDGFVPTPEEEPFIMALQNKLAAAGEAEAAPAEIPAVVQFEALKQILQNKRIAREMAQWQHDAYYRGVGEEPPAFILPKETGTDAEKEKIAMNLAGVYAVECGLGVLCERYDSTPLEVLELIRSGQLPEEDMLLLARFANATWKAGQYFRSPERVERDTFRPAVMLTPEELQKDFDQINAAAEQIYARLTATVLAEMPDAERRELESGIDGLIAELKSAGPLSDEDEQRVRETALTVMYAHRDQKRKGGAPYFIHQLDTARRLIRDFGVAEPVYIQIALLHDTREDEERFYDDFRDYAHEHVRRMGYPEAGDREEDRLNQILLGVRMLSKLEGEKYEEMFPDKAERTREYYRRLVNPRSAYDDKRKGSDKWYTDDYIHKVQLIKLADRMSNLDDMDTIFTGEVEPDNEFPARLMGKTFEFFIPYFVNAGGTRLTPEEIRKFYVSFVRSLEKYALLKGTGMQDRARPLIVASENAMLELGKVSMGPEGLSVAEGIMVERIPPADITAEDARRAAAAQVEAAKGVIGDLRQDNPDIIVMPGSEFFIAQQEPVIRSTTRKLHRDYGQETLPYSYKYGEDWRDNLLLLMEERVVPAFEKERKAKKDPRMLLYLPVTQDERDAIFDKGGLLEKYAHLSEFITVVIESDIPSNGMIDNVMHIVLAKALLNYRRFDAGTYSRAAAERVLGLVGSVIEPGSIDLAKYTKDPEQLIKDIINGLVILRIRKIDFTELQEWKRTQDAVLRAL